MKIGIIIESGYPDRLAEAQVRALVGTNDFEIEEVGRLYEEADDAIARLRERGCQRLEVLHRDDFNLQRFEGALITEYGNLFERGVEVVPEGFYRLREGDQKPIQVKGSPAHAVIFPFNFPTGIMNQEILNDFIKNASEANAVIVDYCADSKGPFLGSAYRACLDKVVALNQNKGILGKVSDWTASNAQNLTDLSGQDGYQPSDGTVVFPGQPNKVPIANVPGLLSQVQGNGGQDLFNSLLEINKYLLDLDTKFKKNPWEKPVDKKAIEQYLKVPGQSGKISFIKKLIEAVQDTSQYSPGKGRNANQKGEALKKIMDNMGITQDLKNAADQLSKAGGGAILSLGKTMAELSKNNKKDDQQKTGPQAIELIVSHKKFPDIFKAIGEPGLFVKDDEIEAFASKKDDKVKGDAGKTVSEGSSQGKVTGAE